jgi:hypothetical protein
MPHLRYGKPLGKRGVPKLFKHTRENQQRFRVIKTGTGIEVNGTTSPKSREATRMRINPKGKATRRVTGAPEIEKN